MAKPRTRRLTCLLVGESTLLLRCAETLAGRGHTVAAIVTPDEAIRGGARAYRSLPEALGGMDDRPDVLFSIVNRAILRPQDIAFARHAAINYHDSPLPAYAGVNAPSWAILQGESSHGVTWHLMQAAVDAGDILIQRRFPIDDGETALALAAKCYEHALDSFGEVLDRLETGIFHGVPQDLARRTFFPRSKRLPRQGIVRWTDAAADVCRFARSGQLGPYPNDFGLPKILLPDGLLVAFGHARVASAASDHPAGTVVAVEPQGLCVVAGDGVATRISGMTTLDGRAFDAPASLVGCRLPALTAAEEATIEAAQVAAATREDETRSRFGALPAPLRPRGLRPFRCGDDGEHVFERSVETGKSAGAVLATVMTILLRHRGTRPALVGVLSRPLVGFMRIRPFVCGACGAEALAAAIDLELQAPQIPADLPARFPELRGAAARLESISVCLSADPEPGIANPGLVICHGDGRLILRFAASQIAAHEAASMANALFGERSTPLPTDALDGTFVHQRIFDRAQSAPEAIAVEYGRDTLTFGELATRARALTARLREIGAGRELTLAVLLPQGIAFPVAVLAVLESGAAYVPLDTNAPLHRLRAIVRDAKPLAVITDGAHAQLARQLPVDVVLYPPDEPGPAGGDPVATAANDLAYLIYTSGSTGEPKASMIEHGALAHLVDTVIARHAIAPGDRVLQLCPVGFDASVEEIFSALCAGATLVIRSASLLDSADAFLDFCEDNRLTIIGIYAPMLGDIVTAMGRRGRFPATVRLATTGGESVSATDAEGWREFFATRGARPPQLLNVYGLTETTVANVTADLSRAGDAPDAVPIGHPLPGNRARVVGATLADVSPGSVGELLLAGPQLARGYWNRPAVTASRFFRDPVDGTRWFRTGDLVRTGRGGELYFVGRVDRQVKVNGVRIELEDVERAMLSHPHVRHAAACVQRLQDGRTLLAGFFSPVTEGLGASLQRHLEQRLPEAMRPRRLLGLESFPVNDRGKTDAPALAETLARLSGAGTPHEAGDEVSRIWQDFFPWGGDAEGEETFFDLGGDSLSALRLLLRVEQETGVLLPASAFFQEPTLAGLRRLTRTFRNKGEAFDPVVPLQAEGSKTPVYVIHGIDGDVNAYVEMAKSFGSDRPIFGVMSHGLGDRNQRPRSVDQAVSDIRNAIVEHRPEGPWILMGYSWAGVLAYETAIRLFRESDGVPLVIMVETLAPLASFSVFDRMLHLFRTVPGWTLRRGLEGWIRVLKRNWPGGHVAPSASSPSRRGSGSWQSIHDHFLRLAQLHTVSREPRLTIHLIRGSVTWPPVTPMDDMQRLWRDCGWRVASGADVQLHHIQGRGRTELLRQPKSRALAELMATICQLADHGVARPPSPPSPGLPADASANRRSI
jgi:amino acid adenylation domain-containing protein